MRFDIEWRIETLTQNAVMAKGRPAAFAISDITFTHWEFNYRDGWMHHYWLAKGKVKADGLSSALITFSEQLLRLIPRISLIGQSYVEWNSQPYLVVPDQAAVAYYRFVRDVGPVGLMFTEKELKALNVLLSTPVPEEFYRYWNDAVNSTGYSSKLLLMFSAIEALVKIRDGRDSRAKDWDKLELILGKDLKIELFGTKENSADGLRHRLVHGEYFNVQDSGKDYLDKVHKKIIAYFNEHVFKERLIEEHVVRPQRHLFGNKEQWRGFIKPLGGRELTLKEVLNEPSDDDVINRSYFESVRDNTLIEREFGVKLSDY